MSPTECHPEQINPSPASSNHEQTNHSHTPSQASRQPSMDTAPTAEAAPGPIRFRAGKKRKAYRQRTEDQDQDSADTPKSPASATAPLHEDTATQKDTDEDDGDASVAAALRLRNARRGRLGGVAFRNSNRPDDEINDERALVPREPDEASQDTVLNSVANRFTHQTGMLTDLNDKHMYV